MVCIKIYLIFTENLNNRTENINTCLNVIKTICGKNNIDVIINIIREPSSDYIDANIDKYNSRVDYSPYTDNTDYNNNIINLNSFNISNYEKHRNVYKLIDEDNADDNETYYMIIEDDILICDIYIDNIEEMIKNIKTIKNDKCDILFLTLNTINDESNIIEFNDVYKVLISKSCYFIEPRVCIDLYNSMHTFKVNLKIFLSKSIKDNNIKAYFYNKNTFIEGSKIGIYPSSTNSQNHLYFNNNYIELFNISNKEIIEKDDIYNAENIYIGSINIESADILNIMGIIYYKYKDYTKAKKYATEALYNLKKNKGYIQRNSNILCNCINIYQYEQEMLEECSKSIPKY